MKLIKFNPGHLKYISPRDMESDYFDMFVERITEHYKSNKENQGFTLVHEGAMIACGGVYKMWNNVGESWLIGSDCIPNKKIAFHKAVLKGMNIIRDSGAFHRIQSIVRSDWVSALGWANILGFKIEGMLKQYTPDGIDCFIYRLEGL